MENFHRQITILLANLPTIVEEVFSKALDSQPDMRLLGRVDAAVDLLLRVGIETDVVILGVNNGDECPGICSHLLSEFPHLRIVVLSINGEQATMYWMALNQQRIDTMSGEQLLANIREICTRDEV